MKFAVATKDGIAINQHFGHAKKFWIYQVNQLSCELIETREVAHYCLGNSANQSAMTMILQTINDCDAVFVAKIGDGPVDKLQAIGVTAITDYAYEAICDAVIAYARACNN